MPSSFKASLRLLKRPFSYLDLTKQVALLTLIPILIFGFFLTRWLQQQVMERALNDARQSTELVARTGIQPGLTEQDFTKGFTPQAIRALDTRLSDIQDLNLARSVIWNSQGKIIYSDDHSLIGSTQPISTALAQAIAGQAPNAQLVTQKASGISGVGPLIRSYTPLRLKATGPSAGALELYFFYDPIAGSVSFASATITLIVYGALALIWIILLPIVAAASRKLRATSRENHQLAHYDQLTGLPNRTLFSKQVAKRNTKESMAVILVGLDRFKEINDTLGHKAGDAVLREVAHRLEEQLREDMSVARLGSDEFVILCPQAAEALSQASAVRSSMNKPVSFSDTDINIEASIGIATSADGPYTLLRQADIALARAKNGRTGIEIYSKEHDTLSAKHLKLLGQVRDALQREEFVLHYQPKVALKDRRLVGVEALLRWRHPKLGMLFPADFIPFIERTSLITPLTLYAIDHSLAQLAAWHNEGRHLDLHMAVNLSTRDLASRTLPHDVKQLLMKHGFQASSLTLEVTESASMADPEGARETLEALRKLGVDISIDDFGTGNASIAYLAQMPATEIKIDRSFVMELKRGNRAEALLRSIIELADNFSLGVVAEGIETEEVAKHLCQLGCQIGQGYLFSRPVSPEQIFLMGKEKEPII